MRKTISNGINRRAVYKFQCTGPCNRMKFTYVYDRAKAGMCLSCSRNTVDPNQATLFTDMAEGESIDVTQQILVNKNGAVIDMRTIAPNGEILRDFQEEENQGYPLPSDFKKLKDIEVQDAK